MHIHDGGITFTDPQGSLSFRIGDFYSGKDTEQMRLTAEGNLGIGITNPQARLDVDGVIRASQGIIFPDGTTQYSAASKTLGAKSTMPGQESDHILGGKHKFHTEASGTGTQNHIAKWTGNADALGDSGITETASGDIGIGTAAPGGVFDLQRNNAGDILQRFWNTGSGGAKLRYVAATGATSQVQLTDLNEWLMSIAGNNTVGMQFRVRNTTDPNTEPGLSAAARMTILRNGNVGIGTTGPGAKLDVNGDINTSTQYNINGASVLSVAGIQNLFAGFNAGIGTTGSHNSFFGFDAGENNTMGGDNCFFGIKAGLSNTTENFNTFIGAFSNGQAGITRATAIGHRAQVMQSDSLG